MLFEKVLAYSEFFCRISRKFLLQYAHKWERCRVSMPKYRTVVETLKAEILSGKHPVSKSLPSVRSLIRRFGVSDTTVLHALDDLTAQGYVSRRQGRGTFVTKDGSSRKIGMIISGLAEYSEFFQPIASAIAAVLKRTLESLGRNVPNDILLAGFDDVKVASLTSPSLTTIHQPCERIAEVAFSRLLGRIARPDDEVLTIYVEAPLIVRDSTTQLRKGKSRCGR